MKVKNTGDNGFMPSGVIGVGFVREIYIPGEPTRKEKIDQMINESTRKGEHMKEDRS